METNPLILQLRLRPQAFATLRQFHELFEFEPTITAIACKWLARWVHNPPYPPERDEPDTFGWVLQYSRVDPEHKMLWLQLHGDLAAVLKRRARVYRDVVLDRCLTVDEVAAAVVNAEGRYYAALNNYTYQTPPPPTPWRGSLGGPRI